MLLSPHHSFHMVWRGLSCRVIHQPNYVNDGWSRLTIEVISPRDAPLPFAESGYALHEMDFDELTAAGGPEAFFHAWLERDAGSPRYASALARWQQFDMFQ